MVSCSVFWCVAVCFSVLQCVAACFSMLLRVAVCCSVCCGALPRRMMQTNAVCSSVVQCVTVWCSMAQCGTVVYDEDIYGVASIRRLLKIIGLFCRISSDL